MPPVNSTVVTIPLASDHLTPADILSDLSIILASGYGELRVVVQDGMMLTSRTTIHRLRANNRQTRATLR